MKRQLHPYLRLLINAGIAILAVLMVVGLILDYLHTLDTGLRQETSQTLEELAMQSAARIEDHIRRDSAQLITVSRLLSDRNTDLDSLQAATLLSREASYSVFDRLFAIPLDGTLEVEGETYNFADMEAFQQALVGKTSVTFAYSKNANDYALLMFTPIFRGGSVYGVVMGHYYADVLRQLMDVSSFQGSGYNYLANRQGYVLLRSSHPAADPDFYSVVRDFDKAILDQKDLNQMLDNMRNGLSGSLFYKWDQTDRIMSYTPIRVNDWYLLSVVPQEVVRVRSNNLFRQAIAFVFATTAVLILLIIYFFAHRTRDQRYLAKAHREIVTLYNALPGGVFRCLYDPYWTVIFANEGFYRFLGYSREEFRERFNNQMVGVICPEDLEGIARAVSEQIQQGNTVVHENRLVCADGSTKWIWINSELSACEDGKRCFYCTFVDITSRREAEEQARLNQQRYEIVMDQSCDTIFEWNLRDSSIYHTKNFQIKFGYMPSANDFPQSEADFVHPDDRAIFLAVCARIQEGEGFASGEFRIRRTDGVYLWSKISITSIRDSNGNPWKAVGILADIDEQKRVLEQVRESAKRDPLTGLYNKGASALLIDEYLSRSRCAALLMLDADNFKHINDTLGHSAGDLVLRELSARLSTQFRDTDLVGRIGGDEFVVYLNGVSDPDTLAAKAATLVNAFERPIDVGDRLVEVTCSIGIARFPADGETYAQLIDQADHALYCAKHSGKNQFFICPSENTP